jgi:cation diffusion facilitator CzcD-associated flavoprotein CzcO
VRPPVRVAVVGAGVAGIGLGVRLQQAGIDFRIFEKAPEIGGTWRDNRYPGLTCDVPAFVYTYSFARDFTWERVLAGGDAILDYLRDVHRRFGLDAHTRCDTELTEARWDGRRWQLTSVRGDEGAYDVVVHACGFLHHPRLPDIEGLDSFAGPCFHSARWDDDAVLDGRRVGVIGTGSTGVQLTTALAGRARVSLFQRTPQWIFPFPDFPVPERLRRRVGRSPRLQHALVEGLERFGDWFIGRASRRPGVQRTLFRWGCTANLARVRDRALRRRLVPRGEPMCKRPVMSTRFYRAIQEPGVELVDTAIERVEPGGVVTADGRLHELDVLVLATGFHAHAYMRPMRVVGPSGRTLDEEWRDGPVAYRSIALAGFPNMFMMLGPHAPLLSVAIHQTTEREADYIVQMIDAMRAGGDDHGVAALAPSRRATDEWFAEIAAGLEGTVWDGDCNSWYLDRGRLPIIWPFDRARWFDLLATPRLDHYEALEPAGV